MANKYFKDVNIGISLPSRIASKTYDRLKKFAHSVWDLDASAGNVNITRKHDESVSPNIMEDDVRRCQPGTRLILFTSGQKLEATLVGVGEDDTLVVDVGDDRMEVNASYVMVAQVLQPSRLEVRMVGMNKTFSLNGKQYRVTNISPQFVTAIDGGGQELQLHPKTPVTSP